jgi:hypothetical protein
MLRKAMSHSETRQGNGSHFFVGIGFADQVQDARLVFRTSAQFCHNELHALIFVLDSQEASSSSCSGYIAIAFSNDFQAHGQRRQLIANLVVDDCYAALRREAQGEDFRSNMTAGGRGKKARVTDRMLELASIVGPKLKRDGIFFAGLDIVADRIVEINSISTGGLNAAGRLQDVDFAPAVSGMIERKVEIRRSYGGHISNIELATMR